MLALSVKPVLFYSIFNLKTCFFYTLPSPQVNALVLEVGLGGRLDATNAVRTPIVTAITSLGLGGLVVGFSWSNKIIFNVVLTYSDWDKS